MIYAFTFLLKALNPLIFIYNFFDYSAHLESQKNNKESYDRYDFNKQIKYF